MTPKGTLRLDQPRYRAPSPDGPKQLIVVTLADSDLDVDKSQADTVQVTIQIAGSAVQPEVLTLTETEPSSGVFTGTIQLVAGAEVVGNGVLEAKDNDTIMATYADANDGTGNPANVTATALVDNHSPDLTVVAVKGPSAAAPGAAATVRVTIGNDSFGGAAAAFQVAVQLIGPSGVVASQLVDVAAGLAAGATVDLDATVTVPSTLGTYTWKAVVDPTPGVVSEFDETNNELFGNSVSVGPDLIVSALSGPATALAAETVSVSYTVTNAGGSTAGGSNVWVQLLNSGGGVWSQVTASVPALAAGQSYTGSVSVPVPASVNGAGTWKATADLYNYVAETNESNNVLTGNSVQVTGADLTVSALSGPPTALAGQTVSVSYTVTNAAGAGAAGGSNVWVQLLNSGGGVWSQVTASVPALAAGQSYTGSVSVPVPASVKGAGTWKATADLYNYVAETNESNNVLTGNSVQVTGADLTVSALSGPPTALAGQTVSVSYTVTNAAGAGAASGSNIWVQLLNSSGGVWYQVTASVPALAAGQSYTGSVSVPVPAGVNGAGTWKATADLYNYVAETNESNNVLTGNAVQVTGS
ncbi:CARDB domain-containing protein [Anaeromyxobacter oryzisoli]|uniref:CARDB domain-containing protein n=1 Tax=Anaeromyxobacter oryzisoli TaxID=2925408 RepID=UPI001F58CF65|nr:CARDB domain-containing protein [Anaeromyxobacter sp. SG63]